MGGVFVPSERTWGFPGGGPPMPKQVPWHVLSFWRVLWYWVVCPHSLKIQNSSFVSYRSRSRRLPFWLVRFVLFEIVDVVVDCCCCYYCYYQHYCYHHHRLLPVKSQSVPSVTYQYRYAIRLAWGPAIAKQKRS